MHFVSFANGVLFIFHCRNFELRNPDTIQIQCLYEKNVSDCNVLVNKTDESKKREINCLPFSNCHFSLIVWWHNTHAFDSRWQINKQTNENRWSKQLNICTQIVLSLFFLKWVLNSFMWKYPLWHKWWAFLFWQKTHHIFTPFMFFFFHNSILKQEKDSVNKFAFFMCGFQRTKFQVRNRRCKVMICVTPKIWIFSKRNWLWYIYNVWKIQSHGADSRCLTIIIHTSIWISLVIHGHVYFM